MNDVNALRPARSSERDRRQRWRHQLAMAAATITAPFMGRAFPSVLERGWRYAARGHFAVPAPWFVHYFGPTLELETTPQRLESIMTDWISSTADPEPATGSVWHINRFALGGGDWSALLSPLFHNQVYQEALQLKAADLRFRETRTYADYCEAVARSQPRMRNYRLLDTRERVDAYFAAFIHLFESIGAHSLQRRRSLRRNASHQGALAATRRKPGWLQWFNDWNERDIGVAVSAVGSLHRLPGGQHRMAVAHVLGLATVPVTVRLLHSAWVSSRMQELQQPLVPAIIAGLEALRENRRGKLQGRDLL